MNKLISLSVVGLTALGLAGCAPAAQEEATVEATVVESAVPEVEVSNADELTVEGTEVEETSEGTETVATETTETGDLGQLATADSTAELLSYLIEEEKLAHDVYTVLYDTYGSKVFGNILESESTHQDQVLGLLDAYGVDDPRSTELGVFNNPELQDLYDQLIAKGMQSAQDAYEVGVMIEEKDIADITAQLATASDAEVVSVLEKLRSGSENHLRAFNRQL